MAGWWRRHRQDQAAQAADEAATVAHEPVAVAAPLEHAIGAVEHAAAECVDAGPGATTYGLRAAIAVLDEQTQAGDAFTTAIGLRGSRYGGMMDPGVLGETSYHSVVDHVSVQELQCQITMVKAAKAFLASPGPDTAAELRDSLAALSACRSAAPTTPADPAGP
jgi:hypothetical protein